MPRHGQQNLCRPGFTLIELTLGLIIITMIMGTLSVLSLAVSSQWQNESQARQLDLQSAQTMTLVERLVRSCQRRAWSSRAPLR